MDPHRPVDATVERHHGAGEIGGACHLAVEDDIGAGCGNRAFDVCQRADTNVGAGRLQIAGRRQVDIDKGAGDFDIARHATSNRHPCADRVNLAPGLRHDRNVRAGSPYATFDRAANIDHGARCLDPCHRSID